MIQRGNGTPNPNKQTALTCCLQCPQHAYASAMITYACVQAHL
ncbi:hypothetical protein HMPREF6745_2812 [Prevotella sp. oral taxon 472 str. F0295]|nr:hypothetical protein HMPREF6745_2812 [Prevotella sp. oral taxon 472 str. F0295]